MTEAGDHGFAMEVLERGLFHRSHTVAELAELLGRPEDEVRRAIHYLDQIGFATIEDDGQLIAYRRPDITLMQAANALAERLRGELLSTFDEAGRMLGALPALSQAWYLSEGSAQQFSAELLQGADAPAQAWRQHFAENTPSLHKVCVPSLEPVVAAYAEPTSPWVVGAISRMDSRLIVSVEDARDPVYARALALLAQSCTGIRVHPNPPGLFWVSDGYLVGMPIEWGGDWKAGTLTAKSQPLGKMLDWVFELFWHQSVPLGGEEKSWEPLLALVAEGMTIEAAAYSLGLTARTGRRRVAAAMAHYGVHSQFSLGRAWEADRARR